jgi:hypothetical protein
MSDIFAMCQPALKDRGNNLAEAIVKRTGTGMGTFYMCPRVVDGNGNVWLWANLQRSESVAGADWDWIIPDLGRDVDLADAQALLFSACVLRPEDLQEDPLPDIAGRFVIGIDVSPQAILTAYGLTTPAE